MARSTELSRYLPNLRRYARALTGSQQTGDTLVIATLQKLAGLPDSANGGSSQFALYRQFSCLWNDPDGCHPGRSALEGAVIGPERHLAAMQSPSRQAFLLVAMEGFAHSEAARILGITEAEFEVNLSVAGREIGEQLATDVFIIEDEFFVATDIERVVLDLGHRVVGIERTHRAAVAAIRQTQPSLVLADVQLADGSSGIDAVNDILVDRNIPVVFVTAYPNRLLTGTKPEPTYLIAKPFNAATVRAVISQVLFFSCHERAPTAHGKVEVIAASRSHGLAAQNTDLELTAEM